MAEINRAKVLLRKVFRDRAKQVPTGPAGCGSGCGTDVFPKKGCGSACSMDVFPKVWKERFLRARKIAAYRPLPDELSLDALLKSSMRKEGTFCFPRVEGDEISFYEPESEDSFRTGAFSIEEPDMSCEKVQPGDIDIILVPAVAYDLDGTRIGRGKGFYDRFIAQTFGSCGKIEGKYLIGVVPKSRILGWVPADPWDLKVDAILTEEALVDLAKTEPADLAKVEEPAENTTAKALSTMAFGACCEGKGEKERR